MFFFYFFNDTATTEIYTLSLHDALPIYGLCARNHGPADQLRGFCTRTSALADGRSCPSEGLFITLPSTQKVAEPPPSKLDRKSTRLNSSHLVISYAVFCLKKKKKSPIHQ